MQGVCNLHGIACPSYSTDHDRARNVGLSPTMVSDNYMDRLIRSRGGKVSKEKYGGGGGDYVEDAGGDYITEGYYGDELNESTALSLGDYPVMSG